MTPAKPIPKGIDQVSATGFRCHWLPIGGVHFKVQMCSTDTFNINDAVPGAWDFDTCQNPFYFYVNREGLAKEYWYRVRAKNAAGEYGEWSDAYHIMLYSNPLLKVVPSFLLRAWQRLINSRKY